MKKVIALALTLAMVLAIGVTAFAASETEIKVASTSFVIDEKEVIEIAGGVDGMKIKDVNGFMTFGSILKLTGETNYAVEVTGTKLGITEIVVTDKNGNELDTQVVVVVEPEKDPDPAEDRDVYTDEAAVTAQGYKSVITIDLDGKVGISAKVYNAATKLHPEAIVIKDDGFTVTLYRGDYKTTTLAKDIIFNVTVADEYWEEVSGKDVNMNNRVLAALGNNKADPFYVMVESINLDAVADKPEFTVDLDNYFAMDEWVKTNNSKAMAVYSFDKADDTVAVVAKSIKVNNNYENVVTMPTVASGVYVFVDATNAATSSANVKNNVSTGANDMMAVAVVFATIALAAGVSKKVR